MRQILALVAIAVLLGPCESLACESFGKDSSAVDKVQSSWALAEAAMERYQYAEALRHLESTYIFVPAIKQPFIRTCVADGAQIRIVSARAGATYISAHPGDTAGAKLAADKAWRAFPIMHNCP